MEKQTEAEIMELLKAVLQEQKESTRLLKDNKNNFAKLEEQLQAQWIKEEGNASAANIDFKPVIEAVEKGMETIQSSLTAQLKNVPVTKRILLFPEQDAREYYRIVFGRFFFWMLMFLLSAYVFVLGKQAIQGWQNLRLNEAENSRYKSAWQEMYKTEGKQVRKRMDSMWRNAIK